MIEATVNRIAEKILALDEASLTSLWEKYKRKMEQFDATREWEKAAIVFFIINSIKVKNQIFNEQILSSRENHPGDKKPPKGKPDLRLIK